MTPKKKIKKILVYNTISMISTQNRTTSLPLFDAFFFLNKYGLVTTDVERVPPFLLLFFQASYRIFTGKRFKGKSKTRCIIVDLLPGPGFRNPCGV